jgi:hypothetical protein
MIRCLKNPLKFAVFGKPRQANREGSIASVLFAIGILLLPWSAQGTPLTLSASSSNPANFSGFTISFNDTGNGILDPGEVTAFSGITAFAQQYSVLAAIPDIPNVASASSSNLCGSGSSAWCFSSASAVTSTASAALFSYQITNTTPPSVTPIAGTLNFTGALSLDLGGITFVPGGAMSVLPSTGSFEPLNGTDGTVKNLSFSSQPVGTPLMLQQFIALAGDPNIELDLTEILPGVGTTSDCANLSGAGTCTPAGTPFNIIGTGLNTSEIAFDLVGLATNMATGESNPFDSMFTAEIDIPFADLISTLSAGGSLSSTYLASITATSTSGVPEPATLALMGLGFAGMAYMRRRTA